MIPANQMLDEHRRERLIKDFTLIRAATAELQRDEWTRTKTEWINRVRLKLDAVNEADDSDLEAGYRAWMMLAAEAAGAAEALMAESDGVVNFIFDVPDAQRLTLRQL